MLLAVAATRSLVDNLSLSQQQEIAETIKNTNRPYCLIGDDWLISVGQVGRIAKKFGVERRKQ